MIVDFYTKTGSHYRGDVAAQTIECVGPDPFPPHAVDGATFGPDQFKVGARTIVWWRDGGPYGQPIMITSRIERIEWREAGVQ